MRGSRRQFLSVAAGGLAIAAWPGTTTRAQAAYPNRSVRIVVGYTAGGVSDILARLLGEQLSRRLGQAFVVENRPGAASNVAADFVAHAEPDGYTLFLAGISNAINVSLYPDLDFNFVRDFTPVAIFSRSPLVMEVAPGFPAKTVGEFIAYAKAHPGTIAFGSAGTGGATHVGGELFQMLTGTKFTHVPYRGSPQALSDLVAGRIQVMFDNIAASITLIRNGQLRPLGVSDRNLALPDVPLIGDSVPGYEAYVWNGLAAPKGCPADIVATLNGAVNEIVADSVFKAKLADLGNTAVSDTPASFGRLIAADTEKWAKVVSFAGIKPQ